MFWNLVRLILETLRYYLFGSTKAAWHDLLCILQLLGCQLCLTAINHMIYPPTSNVKSTLVGNNIFDHSDVVGAYPAVLLQLHLHSQLNTWLQWIGQMQMQDKTRNIYLLGFGAPHIRGFTVMMFSVICWSLGFRFSPVYWTPLHVFSCDQAALQMVKSIRLSICLSVRLSVCLSVTPFWLCSHHHIIKENSGVITNDKRDVHAKGEGQRSKVKVTEVITQLSCCQTVTPVWIHIWWKLDVA